MDIPFPDYLKKTDNLIEFVGTRLTIADVMRLYYQGYSPEMIALEYPSLTLATLYHFVGFYLDNSEAVDASVKAYNTGTTALRDSSPNHVTLADLRLRLSSLPKAASA